jgi:type IV pilus assembly protein PilM
VSPVLSKTQSGSPGGSRPPAVVEVTPDGVLAAAMPRLATSPVYGFTPMPEGALVAGIDEPNLRAPGSVSGAIRAALDGVSPRSRAVTLILPDTSVRVFVLDFDSLPSKPSEVFPVLRFRLRKMVPFDVEKAGISYQVLTQTKSECRVLIAILPGQILEEYETAVRSAGYEPGAVLPSSLAALAALDSMEAVLAASLSGYSLTTVIANGQDLLLYRTQNLPADPEQRLAEVQRNIAVAAAYYEDKLGARPQKLHFVGMGGAGEFRDWLNDPELAVVDLAPRPGKAEGLQQMSLAGVTGALAGA